MNPTTFWLSRFRGLIRVSLILGLSLSAMNCGSCEDATGGGDANNQGARDAGDKDGLTSDASPTDAVSSDAAGDDADGISGNDAQVCEGTVCGGVCCAGSDECIQEQCLAPCGGTRCGDSLGLCCLDQDVCLGGGCVTPGAACEVTEDCNLDEICEPTLGQCVPRDAVNVCEYRPPVGEFSPEIACSWPSGVLTVNPGRDRVVMAPVVANLTDDNGDGLTNTDDIPDLVFLSDDGGCCDKPATLRILSGECNPDGTMQEIASINSVQMIHDGSLAIGDLNGDGVPEIVAIGYNGPLGTNERQNPQGVVALERVTDDGSQWEVMWRNTEYPTWNVHTRGGAIINLADLDGDGSPEVIVGNVALNGQDGTLLWDGNVTPVADGVTVSSRGIGNNAFLGPSSAVGDVNLDGKQEVIAGNTLYAHDGTVLWTYEYTSSGSSCQGPLTCDGFSAMANFDDDPEAEIVIVRQGEVFILEHTGELLWKAKIPQGSCTRNESGPPTIADFNGDGQLEIGTAGADFYAVMSMACDPALHPGGVAADCDPTYPSVLWAKPNQDCSSRATASSLFDFEGDGKAEMVYADETTFRIRAGADGALLFEDATHRSNTRIEMPIIADIDNDGNAEIVVPSNSIPSIKVWADVDDNWVRTRRIWNQHGYSVTNVTEDGQIPAQPQPNWSNARLNNYRQQSQPGGIFDAPDLLVEEITLGNACVGARVIDLKVKIANRGALGQPAGVPVRVAVEHGVEVIEVASVLSTRRLLPGQFEILSVPWTVPDGWWDDGFNLLATIDPNGQTNECNEDNNGLSVDATALATTQSGLVVSRVDVDFTTCAYDFNIGVSITVTNTGDDMIAAGIPIGVVATSAQGSEVIGEVRTTRALANQDSETLSLRWDLAPSFGQTDFDVIATVDPAGEVIDCAQKSSASDWAICMPQG